MNLHEKQSLQAIMDVRRSLSEAEPEAPPLLPNVGTPNHTTVHNTSTKTDSEKERMKRLSELLDSLHAREELAVQLHVSEESPPKKSNLYKPPALKGDEKDNFKKMMAKRRRMSEGQESMSEHIRVALTTKGAEEDDENNTTPAGEAAGSIDIARGTDFATLKKEIDARIRRNSIQMVTSASSSACSTSSEGETTTSRKTQDEENNTTPAEEAAGSIDIVRGTDFATLKKEIDARIRRNSIQMFTSPSSMSSSASSSASSTASSPSSATNTSAPTNTASPASPKDATNTDATNTTSPASPKDATNTSSPTSTTSSPASPKEKVAKNIRKGTFLKDGVAISIQGIVSDLDNVFQSVHAIIDATWLALLDRAIERAALQCQELLERATHTTQNEETVVHYDPRIPFIRSLLVTALHVSARARASLVPRSAMQVVVKAQSAQSAEIDQMEACKDNDKGKTGLDDSLAELDAQISGTSADELAVVQAQLAEIEKAAQESEHSKRAFKDYHRAISISREIENLDDVIELLNESAELSIKMGQLDDAVAYIELRKVYDLYRIESGQSRLF